MDYKKIARVAERWYYLTRHAASCQQAISCQKTILENHPDDAHLLALLQETQTDLAKTEYQIKRIKKRLDNAFQACYN